MQIVSQEGAAGLERLRAEYVVRIQGQLRKRVDPNPNIPTGMVELVAEQVCTYSKRSSFQCAMGQRSRSSSSTCKYAGLTLLCAQSDCALDGL